MGVERDIERLDAEKAIREQYDGDSRFDVAARVVLKPADYY